MDEDEAFQSGLLWAHLAKKYFRAADLIYKHWYEGRIPTPDVMLGMIEPISQLYGQSIELNLKAYLRFKGLRHRNIHNLRDLLAKSRENGLQVSDEHDIVGKLSDVFHISQDPEYVTKYAVRYPKEPGAPHPIFIDPTLMREVAGSIGLAVQSNYGAGVSREAD